MIGQTLLHYRITAALGAGGMGEVYRATDTNLGRDVAIKVLPPEVTQDEERLARFRREAHLLAALNHPNIAAIHGLEEAEGKPFLVLELVDGEDLKERLQRGAIPVEESLGIAMQIAEALEEAHGAGIVHRDLKPANIKLTRDGKVKVLDFGLAKAYAAQTTSDSGSLSSQSPTLDHTGTRAGVILGTAAYMAPEQASGKEVDKRADVWSFGVVLFEMLTGQRLFTGDTVTETLASVLKGEPPWDTLPANCPPALTRLLHRCLQKKSRARLHDMADARLDLEDALSGEGEDPAHREVVLAPPWRRALPWGLAAVLAATFLALAFRSAPEPGLTQLDMVPPPGTQLWGLGLRIRPAVSPDGRMLAFSGQDAEAETHIYVRPFAAGEARALAGTDRGSSPFWSPDSRFVGFFADGQLKKVAARGGEPVTLCDAPNGRGGSWSPHGVIVFGPDLTTPLHRVPEEGGKASPITRLGSSGKDDSHRFPHFLPDGRRFLYLARFSSEIGEAHAVRVGSLDGDEDKLLMRSVTAATYASGHLLYMREGALQARPFDLSRLELTGEEVSVVPGVRVDSATGFAAFSASPNGVLAHLSGERQTRSNLEWHDRQGTSLGILGDPASYVGVVLSRDGTRAATAILDANDVPDLWIYDISRELKTRFTFDRNWDLGAVWSPDGRDLVFTSWRRGHADPYRKPLEGSGEIESLFSSNRDAFATDLSPDGKLLVFQRLAGVETRNLWILPLEDDGEPRPFLETEFAETAGVFSPDGRWMAYGSNESERREVYVAAFPGGGQKQQVSADGGVLPQWRGDGREIFYEGLDRSLMAVEVAATDERLVIGEPERLLQMPQATSGQENTPARTYSAMPDGQRFLVITPVGGDVTPPITVVLNWPKLLEN